VRLSAEWKSLVGQARSSRAALLQRASLLSFFSNSSPINKYFSKVQTLKLTTTVFLKSKIFQTFLFAQLPKLSGF
jgi:hypothetical protein